MTPNTNNPQKTFPNPSTTRLTPDSLLCLPRCKPLHNTPLIGNPVITPRMPPPQLGIVPLHILRNLAGPIPLHVDVGGLSAVIESRVGFVGGDRGMRGPFGGFAAVGGMLGGI